MFEFLSDDGFERRISQFPVEYLINEATTLLPEVGHWGNRQPPDVHPLPSPTLGEGWAQSW